MLLVQTIEQLLQLRMAQLRSVEGWQALSTVAQIATDFGQPDRVEGQDANAITLIIGAGTVVNMLRRHQQDVPCPGYLLLAARGIALLAGDDQADVIFQVKVPGKGKLLV
ncbi:MAG: hypothetical protein RRY21_01100, partial [Oscillospiraceae bacterium]